MFRKIIEVHVKPNARRENVEVLSVNSFKVHVNAPAQEGKANRRVIELLAKHLNVPKSRLTIVHGEKGKRKLIEVGG